MAKLNLLHTKKIQRMKLIYLTGIMDKMTEIRKKMYYLVSNDKGNSPYYYELQKRLIRLDNHFYFCSVR